MSKIDRARGKKPSARLKAAQRLILRTGRHAGKPLNAVPSRYLHRIATEWSHLGLKEASRLILDYRGWKPVEPRYIESPAPTTIHSPRSGVIPHETPWQVRLKRICTGDGPYQANVPVAIGKVEAIADLADPNTDDNIGLLDLDRIGDVGRVTKLCKLSVFGWVIVKVAVPANGLPMNAHGIDFEHLLEGEASEVIERLVKETSCRAAISIEDSLYERARDNDSIHWLPATHTIPLSIENALQAERLLAHCMGPNTISPHGPTQNETRPIITLNCGEEYRLAA